MIIKSNKDGSYSASMKYQGRVYVAEGYTRAEAIQECWKMSGRAF